MEEVFDIAILGGGVAGMTAALYAKRRGKNVCIIDKLTLGGQVLTLEKISNFPSQKEIDGLTLAKMFKEQVNALEIPVLFDDIKRVDLSKEVKSLVGKKTTYLAKSVIIATGVKPIELDVECEGGVSYCAVCDGHFYKGKDVLVASRGGSGLKAGKYLSGIAKSVTVLDEKDMSAFEKANNIKNLKVVSNAYITKVEKFSGVWIGNKFIKGDMLFVELGKVPATEIFCGQIQLDSKGFVVVDQHMQTSAENVYAVGDVRNGELKQIVTACSDGAIAGNRA